MRKANAPVRILIVDDHFAARLGLRALLEAQEDMEVVAEAHDGKQAIEVFEQHRPDLVVMDSRMPDLDGAGATAQIRARHPDARILILSSFDTETEVRKALEAGASGYLMKEAEPPELLDAVRTVAHGRRYLPGPVAAALDTGREQSRLTEREIKMLELIARGLSNRDIAKHVSLTPASARIYVSNLFQKLGVGNRSEAIAVALQRGLIRVDHK